MPFEAWSEGERVIPSQVQDHETVDCLGCSQSLHVVRSHRRNGAIVARHFRHNQREGAACAYELDAHIIMKIIAYEAVKLHFEDRLADDGMSLDEASVGGRRPDVLARFETPEESWGQGVAVEVQYRNESKDVDAVSFAYAHHGYSTIWLDPTDFYGKSIDLPDDPADDRVRTPWPLGVPPRKNRSEDGQPRRRARVPVTFHREWWGNMDGSLWIEKAMDDVLGLDDCPGVLGVYRDRRRKATIYHEDLGPVHVQCRSESAGSRIYVYSQRSEPGPPYLSDTRLGTRLFNSLPFDREEVSVDPFLKSLPVHAEREQT